jgi:hypothetical protein
MIPKGCRLFGYDHATQQAANVGSNRFIAPSRLVAVRRNGPCPRGTGKRYKHCHTIRDDRFGLMRSLYCAQLVGASFGPKLPRFLNGGA